MKTVILNERETWELVPKEKMTQFFPLPCTELNMI